VDYTKAQRSAIETIEDPLLIVACAGSGKTQVISQRIVEILRSGAEPRNIVAFTFTERAAAELKERVPSLVEHEFGNVHGLAEMYIGTMHGFALDALHGFVPQTFKYGVLNDIQTRLFIDRRSNKCGLTTAHARVNGASRPLRRWVNSGLYTQVMAILREEEIDESALPADLITAQTMYRHELHQHSYFDFTEVLRAAADLLEEGPDDEVSGALVRHVRDTIRYVVVDEYQDTNTCRSASSADSPASGRTCAWSATTTRRSTSGAVARCPTSSPSSAGTTRCVESRWTTTSGPAEGSPRWPGQSSRKPPQTDCPRRWSPLGTKHTSAATSSH